MPIPVSCLSCAAKLNAPDAAAGKKVKCPKCGAVLQIPQPPESADFEVIEDAPTRIRPPVKRTAAGPPPAKPKSKPVLLDEDDDRPLPKKKSKPAVVADEDEDFDDEPRPLKKRTAKAKKAGGMNLPLVLGGATLATAVVCGLVWYFVIREPEYTFVTPPLAPEDSGTIGGKGPGPLGPPGGGGGGKQPGGGGNPGGGKQPTAWERPTPKPAPAGWKNYSCDDFDTWLPEDAPKPVIVIPTSGRGKEYTWTYGRVKIGALTGPMTSAENAEYTSDPLAFLARGAEKIKLQLEAKGLKCEVKASTRHGLPCQEVRTSPTSNQSVVVTITSFPNKSFILTFIAPGDDEQKTRKELLEPLLANFIPK